MIDKGKINFDWISLVSRRNRKADKILVEKVIRALLLLEGLVVHEIPFVFKGGTALMLHLNTPKRLSIDIDVILPMEVKGFEDILKKIGADQGFTGLELQHRNTNSKIKKTHYKFYYTPLHKSNKDEEYILLDILFEEVGYANVIEIPIQSSFVPIKGDPIKVKVPCLEDMLGDKLTAFAPNTTGIPYFKKKDSMSMEIIKQLYDIGNLFDVANDLEIIKSTFLTFAKTELAYRALNGLTANDVLEDIYQTSLNIVTRGSDGKGNFEQLQLGIRRIAGFIFSESFHLEKAIVLASKTAYISILIKEDAAVMEKYNNSELLKNRKVGEPLNTKLNKLKKSNPEAFFYWFKIYELLKQAE